MKIESRVKEFITHIDLIFLKVIQENLEIDVNHLICHKAFSSVM